MFYFWLLRSWLGLPGGAQDAIQPQAAKEAFAHAYRIGPGDLLEIKVFEVKELDQTVRVSEDGSITLPLLAASSWRD